MGTVLETLASGAARTLQALAGSPPVPYTSRTGLSFGDHSDPRGGMERAYAAYGTVGTLFAIVSQIGNAFARNRWAVYRKGGLRGSPTRKEVLSTGAMVVWNKPNDFMTGRFFREAVQQHLDLVGNGFIVLADVFGLVTEMWPVRPDRMRPVKSADKFLLGYIYEGPNGEDVPLALEQVIHLKYPNPFDPYWGMGPVQSILADIDAARYSAEWNRNFFVNGARPGGVIEVDHRTEWLYVAARVTFDSTILRELRSYMLLAANELGQLQHRGSGAGGDDTTATYDLPGIDLERLR